MPENPNTRPLWKLPILLPLWIIQMLLAVLFLSGIPIVCSQNPGMDFRCVNHILHEPPYY